VVAGAAAWCTVAYLIRRRRGRRLGGRAVAVAGLVGLACWAGPLWDEIASGPGNLRAIAAAARDRRDPLVGGDVVLDQMGRHFGVPAPWMGAEVTVTGIPGYAPAPALVLEALAVVAIAAAAGVWAWRRGRREPGWFVAYAVALVAVSALALSRVPAPLFPYMTVWAWAVSALVWVGAGWAVTAALRSERARRAVAAGAAALAVGASAAATVAAATAEGPYAAEGATVAALGPAVRRELDPGATYRLDAADPGFALVGTGLVSDLRRRGYDVRMPPSMAALEPRELIGDGVRVPTLRVVTVTGTVPAVPPAGARLIASRDPLDADERAELDHRARAVRAATGLDCLEDLDLRTDRAVDAVVADGADPADAARVAELQRAGAGTEVWLSPPGPAAIPFDPAALAAACGQT
jgi:hypothetical protein